MSSPSPPHLLIKNRWLRFLTWQSIVAAALHLILFLLLSSRRSAAILLFSTASFLLSLLLLSLSFFLLSSPCPHPSIRSDFSGWARSAAFFALCATAGFLSAVAVCGELGEIDAVRFAGFGLRGVVFGLFYGAHFWYRKRWILEFPIIQRPFFYSFKMALFLSLKRAMWLSGHGYLLSTVIMLFLPDQFKTKSTLWRLIFQHIKIFIGTATFSYCWEFSYHLLQVVLTERYIFAPPQGSAAAEANPSETLLETLERSSPRSLIKHLAYLDLCVVSESNCEPWRRAAFFEETGDTYKRTIDICLKPLEQLTTNLAEGLEVFSMEKSDYFSKKLDASVDVQANFRLHKDFYDFQICTWCARTLAALTARSRSEDRYGVAQLTGCNKAVMSTLLAGLLSVEACLGKKTNLQASISPANIKWATINQGKADQMTSVISRRRSNLLHANAYAMADVLRTSIYQIVSAFHADMQANAKASILDKSWISEGKPLYGTRDILVQKFSLFLGYQAV